MWQPALPAVALARDGNEAESRGLQCGRKNPAKFLGGNFAGCLFSILYCLFYLNLNTCPGLRVEVRLMPLRLQMRLMDTPLRMEMCERVSPLRTR